MKSLSVFCSPLNFFCATLIFFGLFSPSFSMMSPLANSLNGMPSRICSARRKWAGNAVSHPLVGIAANHKPAYGPAHDRNRARCAGEGNWFVTSSASTAGWGKCNKPPADAKPDECQWALRSSHHFTSP